MAIQIFSVIGALVRGRRIFLFTNCHWRVPERSGHYGRKVAVIPVGGYSAVKLKADATSENFSRFLSSPQWAAIADISKPFDRYIEERLSRRFSMVGSRGASVFNRFKLIAHTLRSLGAVPVLLADSPFSDTIPHDVGFAAEAFRQHGGRVVEYQHGANFTLVGDGFMGPLLTTGLGDLLLEWNDVGCRDHTAYGLTPRSLKFATVGCYKTKVESSKPGRGSHYSNDGRLRVAYAPSLLSVITISGNNVLWDDYLVSVDQTLRLLDQSNFDVVVSLFSNTEMEYFISRRQYSNLKFHSFVFGELIKEADVLIADNLSGSPPDEAMMTEKPVIVFAGGRNQNFDGAYLRDVHQRCIAYDDINSYLTGIGEFVANPDEYLRENVRLKGPLDMARYFGPLDSVKFWRAIEGLA